MSRRVGAAALVLGLVGLTAWLVPSAVSPVLSSDQVRMVYEPPPATGTQWERSVPMTARRRALSGAVSDLGTPACQASAPALFNYLGPAGLDGYTASFGVRDDTRGTSATTRYPGRDEATEAFDATVASLETCGRFNIAAQYGSVSVTLERAPATAGPFSGDRVSFAFITDSQGGDWTSTVTGLRFGNTVSWQTRSNATGDASQEDVDAMMDALLTRLRSVARIQ